MDQDIDRPTDVFMDQRLDRRLYLRTSIALPNDSAFDMSVTARVRPLVPWSLPCCMNAVMHSCSQQPVQRLEIAISKAFSAVVSTVG